MKRVKFKELHATVKPGDIFFTMYRSGECMHVVSEVYGNIVFGYDISLSCLVDDTCELHMTGGTSRPLAIDAECTGRVAEEWQDDECAFYLCDQQDRDKIRALFK